MPIEIREWGGFCKYCDRRRLFRSSTTVPNHVVHALFTIASMGLWAIGWIILTASKPRTTPWLCTVCGTPLESGSGTE